jgi:transcriptional regulator with XRE-family HTH domain
MARSFSESDIAELSRRIRMAQSQKGWTNDVAAEAADLPIRTYCFYRNGEVTRPSPDKLRSIAEALDLDPGTLGLSGPDAQFALPSDYVRIPTVRVNADQEGNYELRRTGKMLPVAFSRTFAKENIAPDLKSLIGYEVRGATASSRYSPGQLLVLVEAKQRVPFAGDYLVRIDDSWDVYSIQRLPDRRLRFIPHNDDFASFDRKLDDGGSLPDDNVEVIGRVAWEGHAV